MFVLVMHQSIPAVPIPPPPGQPRGICSRCQSRGWGIRNFIAARGLGILNVLANSFLEYFSLALNMIPRKTM